MGLDCLIYSPSWAQIKVGIGHRRRSNSILQGDFAICPKIRSRRPLTSQVTASDEDKTCSLLKLAGRLGKSVQLR